MNAIEQTVCFAGHRLIPVEQCEAIKKYLEMEIKKSIEQGIQFFEAGGAIGFDTLAAEMVLALKCQYPEIKLILVLPCQPELQTKYWKSHDKENYFRIFKRADTVKIISEVQFNECTYAINKQMVQESSQMICYYAGFSGGTSFAVSCAEERGIPLVNINNYLVT